MGFLAALVAFVLFVLAGLEVSFESVSPANLVAFGLAALTLAVLLGVDRPSFLGRRV